MELASLRYYMMMHHIIMSPWRLLVLVAILILDHMPVGYDSGLSLYI